MSLTTLNPIDPTHLYEYSFDEMIRDYKPLKNEDDKKYIKIHKYPTIFAVLPHAMKREYPTLSRAGIHIYATRLGLSIFSHSEVTKNIIDIFEDTMYSTNSNNLDTASLFRHKVCYDFCTPTSNNSPIYLATNDDVKSYLSENGEAIGLSEYQMGIMLFFLGIKTATLSDFHKALVNQEIDMGWKIIEMRYKALTLHSV